VRGEQTAILPIHQELVNAGAKLSWSLYGVLNSTDAEKDYKFVTIEVFRNLSDIDALHSGTPISRRVRAGTSGENVGRGGFATSSIA
jgi:hypothetical protein